MAVITRKGYKVQNKLGQGAFGIVYKAVKADGKLSAVKVIGTLLLYKSLVVILTF